MENNRSCTLISKNLENWGRMGDTEHHCYDGQVAYLSVITMTT